MPSPNSSDDVLIDVIVSAPFMENTWIVRRADRPECVIVDPGFQPRQIVQFIEDRDLKPELILLTHGHVDHIAGNAALKEQWPELPIAIGTGDAHMLTDPDENLSSLGGMRITSPPANRLLREGDRVGAAGMEFDVLEIPGHSPGHVVYILRSDPPPIVLGGDVLFAGSIGRCDFPGGNQALLVRGIRQKLFTLPDETRVYPGHGDPTTVGVERRTNPFCKV
ncbi:MAG: MBL fold metallo-hydrolase [Planctomycetaceae bacterium]|nr:MBL fold metallo-hydrolase [Planctomycetaceae bacterium]